jgi:hypothetical protein
MPERQEKCAERSSIALHEAVRVDSEDAAVRLAGRVKYFRRVPKSLALPVISLVAMLERLKTSRVQFGRDGVATEGNPLMPPMPFDDEDRPPTIPAYSLPRARRVQAAVGARRAEAQRRAWTWPSTAASSCRVRGRS